MTYNRERFESDIKTTSNNAIYSAITGGMINLTENILAGNTTLEGIISEDNIIQFAAASGLILAYKTYKSLQPQRQALKDKFYKTTNW